jgi:hypothetical protein
VRDEVRLLATGNSESLAEFVRLVGRRAGLRLIRDPESVAVILDVGRIKPLGPRVEAAAAASGVELRLAAVNAKIVSAGLDGRPSRVWQAIAVAEDERAAARDREEEPRYGLFDFVKLEATESGPGAVGERLDFREDRSLPPEVGPVKFFDAVKFDDVDWHQGGADEAGQPEENASTHIRILLTWLVRHDLLARNVLTPGQIADIRAGAMASRDVLLRRMDDKLLSDFMVGRGARFAADRYDAYLAAYGEVFAAEPDYSVACDEAAYQRVEPVIERLWAEWLSSAGAAT